MTPKPAALKVKKPDEGCDAECVEIIIGILGGIIALIVGIYQLYQMYYDDSAAEARDLEQQKVEIEKREEEDKKSVRKAHLSLKSTTMRTVYEVGQHVFAVNEDGEGTRLRNRAETGDAEKLADGSDEFNGIFVDNDAQVEVQEINSKEGFILVSVVDGEDNGKTGWIRTRNLRVTRRGTGTTIRATSAFVHTT